MTTLKKKILTAKAVHAYKVYVKANRQLKKAEGGLKLFQAIDELRRTIGYVK